MTPSVSPADQSLSTVKKAYRAPSLVRYGDVRSLTQAGSGASQENSASSGPPGCTTQSTKFPCVVSDPRAKRDIRRIGTHPAGFGLYLFHYKAEFQKDWGSALQFGVMADEVEKVMPEAVETRADGLRAVNYQMLGIRQGA